LTRESGFNQNYFDLEKENLRKEIASKINNKSAYARSRLIEIMCAGEPFGVDGDGYLDELDKITNEDLFWHYRNILETSPIEVVLMGNFKNPKIDFPTSKGQLDLPVNFYNPKKEPTLIEEFADVNQEKIVIGARMKPPEISELYAQILYNGILGGGADSKLFKNIRENAGLCYYVFSSVYRFKSIMLIELGVEEKESERAVSLIMDEINKIAESDFTDSDLIKAKRSLLSNFELMEDSQSRTIDFYVSQSIARDETSISEIMKIIEKIDREDIITVGKNVYIDTIYKLKPTKTKGGKPVGENNTARAV
jgi:predicted Zn-dependent peptidase